jgi:hypothetical protein
MLETFEKQVQAHDLTDQLNLNQLTPDIAFQLYVQTGNEYVLFAVQERAVILGVATDDQFEDRLSILLGGATHG